MVFPYEDDGPRERVVLPGQFVEPGELAGAGSTQLISGHRPGPAWRLPSVMITLAQAALTLPWALLSLFMLTWASALPAQPWGQRLLLAWLLAGPFALLPGVEPLLARLFARARPPTGEEAERLRSCWQSVAQDAGVRADTYWVGVVEAPKIAAFPVGARTLLATPWAISELPPQQLQALLAQALGQLRSGNVFLRAVAYWYALPARAAQALAVRILRSGLRILVITSVLNWALAVLTIVTGLLVMVVLLAKSQQHLLQAMVLTAMIAPPLLAWFGRAQIRHADRYAQQLGHGQPLLEVLRLWQQHEPLTQPACFVRLMDPTPSTANRIHHLEQHLGGRWP